MRVKPEKIEKKKESRTTNGESSNEERAGVGTPNRKIGSMIRRGPGKFLIENQNSPGSFREEYDTREDNPCREVRIT